MKLVDDAQEQDLLEDLLESAKPAQPASLAKLHYLLATPFRYDPRRGGSRFRGSNDPGVFYGAGSVRTACAELGYWRWRFLRDAVELEHIDPIPHTAFRTELRTGVIDLRKPPFSRASHLWRDPADYSATQAFARIAREGEVGGILYRSVRDPDPGWCVALLSPEGFATTRPDGGMQTWWLAVRQDAVIWRREDASLIFPASCPTWSDPASLERRATPLPDSR